MNVLFEFATPIGIFDIDKKICESYLPVIKNILESKEDGCRFGYRSQRTPDNLHQYSEFQTLKKVIDEKVSAFCEDVLGIDKNDLEMSGMWSNVQEHGMMHHVHQHPNSFISGALYLQIPDCENPGKIHFTDPRQAKNMIYADFKKESCISSRTIWVKPETGRLLLFPSWLEHGTENFMSENNEYRVSLSFNYKLIRCSYETMRI